MFGSSTQLIEGAKSHMLIVAVIMSLENTFPNKISWSFDQKLYRGIQFLMGVNCSLGPPEYEMKSSSNGMGHMKMYNFHGNRFYDSRDWG